jgi:hypothetical protein
VPSRLRGMRRKQLLQRCLLAIPFIAVIIGVLPVFAVLVFGAGGPGPSTAYASAPPGTYVVVSVAGADEDSILVVSTTDPTVRFQVAGIAHAREIPTMGTVSPDGLLLALIVVEPGALSEAVASLRVVDLESGADTVLLERVDALQEPVWAPDSASVVVVRSGPGTSVGADVDFFEVAISGDERILSTAEDVIAAYPIGFDAAGELVAVRLDSEGSAAVRGDGTTVPMSPFFTRDWQLSPDGSAIAFIESNQESGLRYVPRVVSLSGGGVVAAQSISNGEALGTAWAPASAVATFGYEPNNTAGSVSAQSVSGGFDVPLKYSPDGDALAVRHWSGSSFDEPGTASLIVEGAQGRVTLTGVGRFLGWTAR